MNRKILTLAAALAVAAPALIASGAYAQTTDTAIPSAVTQSQAPALLTITQANVEAEIMKADKPSLVLVTSPNCADCSALTAAFQAQAAKHPEWKFATADAAGMGIEVKDAPLVVVVVPGVGPTFSKAKFAAPADMDVFMAERMDKVAKINAAKAKVDALQTQVNDKNKPFEDEMKALNEQAKVISKPFADRQAAVNADRAKALEPLEKQRDEISARLDAAQKPFYDKIPEIESRMNAATKPMNEEFQALNKQISDMRSKGVSEGDPAMKKATERKVALRAEYSATTKPFHDELNAAYAGADTAGAPIEKEMDAVRAEMQKTAKPFNEQRAKIRNENNEALKDLRTKAADVQQRAKAALGTLPAELNQAEGELENLVYADQQ